MSDCREAGRLATRPWSLPVATAGRPQASKEDSDDSMPRAAAGALSPGRARIGSHLGRGTVNLKAMAVGLSDPGRHHVTVLAEPV